LRHKQQSCKHSQRLLTNVICDVIGYMWVCIQARTKAFLIPNSSFTDITETKVSYLGLIAFRTILTLKRKQSMYDKLLKSISRMLHYQAFKELLTNEEDASLLRDVTDNKHHSALLKDISF
jgi:hypothetical protein